MKKFDIVIGANYGDEGKGRTVNYLANSNSLVILTNGGSQRGHTVIENNVRHVFHHFGSGTLKGASSYACSEFILNPLQFKEEYKELKSKGIIPKLYVDPECRVTTPFDMLTNILRSESKGVHDSTGFGIWETILRYRDKTCFYHFKDLVNLNVTQLKNHFENIKTYYSSLEFIKNIKDDSEIKKLIISPNAIIDNFIDDFKFMVDHVEVKNILEITKDFNHIIFEQGQGLGLDIQYDKEYGTPSNTGSVIPSKIIKMILKSSDVLNINKFYVTRSYLSRHGAGNLVNEDNSLNFIDETNKPNPHQGSIRFALFSDKTISDMLDRIQQDMKLLGGSNNLVITHIKETSTKNIDNLLNTDKLLSCKKFNNIIYFD